MSAKRYLQSVFALLLAFWTPVCVAQSGNFMVAAGYNSPYNVVVAPGQVITLLVQGVGASLAFPVQAQNIPLPTTLAGISVSLHQTSAPPIAVPLLSVSPRSSTCFGRPNLPGCQVLLAEVTAQIPYELVANFPRFDESSSEAVLVVSENGVPGNAFQLAPAFDRIHIITNCAYVQPGDILLPFSNICGPIVTHGGSGALVTPANPAKSGEVLVMYAFGLGTTTPAAKTGEAAPLPALTLAQTPGSHPLLIGHDFHKNAAPQRVEDPTPDQASLLFAGLTPGFVGLYQVNFRVPAIPVGLPPCSIPAGPPGILAVRSNLTVSISGSFSFDGAAICVDPGN